MYDHLDDTYTCLKLIVLFYVHSRIIVLIYHL